MSKLTGMQIFALLSDVKDGLILESAAPLITAGATAAGTAGTIVLGDTTATASTAAKAGFGAWVAKGGWVALVAAGVAAVGVAVGAFFLGNGGDVPPVGTGDVTTEEQENITSTEDVTEFEGCMHSFGNWQFTVMPTCTERGIRTRVCSACGQVEVEDMPAGLHAFDRKSCTLCGEKMTNMEFTSYGDGTCCIKDAGRVRGDMVLPNYSPEGDLVIAIGEKAFSGSFDSLVWPERLTAIGPMAFSECKLPEGFTLPEGLISIGQSAFAYCRGITKIHIPASVTVIEQNALEGVTTLTEITFGEGSRLQTIPMYFAVNTALSAITLPDTITSIGSMAFAHTALKEFSLPDGITSIESFAFTGCTQLTAVNNTAGLTNIGQEAFAECSSLTAFPLPDSLSHIGCHAFRGCTSLSYTEYGGGYYMAIGKNPYAILVYGREGVATASLRPDTLIAVGGAFEGNTSLTSFTFPDSATEIPDRFFYGCSYLRKHARRADPRRK